MELTERVSRLGDRLRTMARSFSSDLNESHLLAHAALAAVLRNDPELEAPDLDAYALRTRLWAARWQKRAQLKPKAERCVQDSASAPP